MNLHAPGYLADHCQLVSDARARQLHSVYTRMLTVLETSDCFGERTLADAATRVWNSLPVRITKSRLIILPVLAVLEDIFVKCLQKCFQWHFYLDSPTMVHCELY